MGQHRLLLGGEIRKSVYVKAVLSSEVRRLQLLQKLGHPVPGILAADGTDGVVAFQKIPQFLQLLGQDSLGLGTGIAQLLRAHAAAFELVHHGHHSAQKFRPGRQGPEGLEPGAHLLRRHGHGNDPAALVQDLPGSAAGLGKDPATQSCKAQDLGVPAGGIPGSVAEPPLGLMGDLLRHQQHRSRLPFLHPLRDQVQGPIPVSDPVLSQQKTQHGPASFFSHSRAQCGSIIPHLPAQVKMFLRERDSQCGR